MSLTLQELRKRGPRVGTFVRKFYDKEEFTFTDGSKEKISEVIFGSDKYNLKSIPAELLEAMGSRKIAASQVKIKVGNKTKALGTLAKTPEFGGKFDDGSSAEKKLDTTLYSELIATYCIAYRILKGKDLERDEFIDPKTGKLNEKTYKLLSKKIVQPSSEALSKSEIRDNLAIYGMQSLGGSISKFNWLEQSNVVAKTLLSNVKIPKNAVIYNDRFFAPGRKSYSNIQYNPYRVFSLSPTLTSSVGPDKWNPADIWIMTPSGIRDLTSFNQKVQRSEVYNINAINNFLQKKYDDSSIIPVSLKKINPSAPHFTLMNSKYFVEQLDISDQTNPPIIEFTEGNKDVKINFTVRTIRLNNPARNMMQSQDRIQKLNGTPVQGSEKHIRIKYNVNKQQLEVEYEQSRPMANRPTAKHGSIGKGSLTDIISKTSRQGIDKLNEIKKPFVETTYAVKRDDYFLTDRVAVDEDNKTLALSYLGDIWETITGDLIPQFFTDRFGRDPKGIQLKINSGEIGIAIGQIPNETVKRRVIQNLYNAASSIGVFKGLNKEERDIIGAAGLNQTTNALRADFVGGIHVKIF